MTNYRCKKCNTLWKNAKPQNKHLIYDETKHQTLQAGKGSCTCSVGEDGLVAE